MKKTLSALLAGVMISGTIPFAVAAEPTTLKDFMASKNLPVPYTSNVDVEADIEVRENGDTEYVDGPISIKQKTANNLPSFDYEATLFMESVRNAFTAYIDKAEALIEAYGTDENKDELLAELDALPVTGEFFVTIKNPDEMIIPEYIKVDNKTLEGFNDATENAFAEVSRNYNDAEKTMTINIKVKDGITKKILEDNLDTYLADLTLTCVGVEIDGFDSYELIGEITGYTNIGDDTSTSNVNENVAYIEYKAVQEDEPSAPINAIVKVSKQSDSVRPGGGGGGASVPTITVTTEVDGAVIDKQTSTNEIKHDPYDLDVPGKDNNLFKGWYNKATGEPITGDEVFKTSTTIVAEWITTGDINIDFVIDGEEVDVNAKKPTSVTVPESAVVDGEDGVTVTTTEFAAVIPSDRKFEGWYLDAEYTIPVEASMTLTEDTTFYGKTSKLDGSDVLDMDHHYAYIIGYPDGYVRPEQNISREEVATIFFRLLTEEARNSLLKKTNNFSDVESTRWSNNAISTMENYGIINGYADGTFKPSKDITRAEFVAMTSRFYELEKADVAFTDISGHWAEEYIESAAAKGWISGYEDGTFKPDKNITRAEAMTIVNHLLKRKVDAEGLHADAVQWADNLESSWYYYEVLEATNSHKCADRLEDVLAEEWTECVENYDWSILEK